MQSRGGCHTSYKFASTPPSSTTRTGHDLDVQVSSAADAHLMVELKGKAFTCSSFQTHRKSADQKQRPDETGEMSRIPMQDRQVKSKEQDPLVSAISGSSKPDNACS